MTDFACDFPQLDKVDAVTIPVPDLDTGLSYCRDRLVRQPWWRNDATGGRSLAAGSDSEIVMTTQHGHEPYRRSPRRARQPGKQPRPEDR